jgi:hypothetical protein
MQQKLFSFLTNLLENSKKLLRIGVDDNRVILMTMYQPLKLIKMT